MQTLETKQYLANTLSHLPTPLTNEQELSRKVNKSLEKCTSCIYAIANEPTLACFCIEEHLFKTGGQLVEKNEEMRKLDKQLSGALFDVDFSIESIKKMKNTLSNFKTTQDLIKDAIFHKQQIDYSVLNKRRFNQQMSKDHSVNDFRKYTDNKPDKSRQNAFQRFSSFEATSSNIIEGIASSSSVSEFKDALKNITQFTKSNFSIPMPSTSQTNTDHSNTSNQTIEQETDKKEDK